MIQRNSAEPDDGNIPQAETLCTLCRMLFLVLENRFRHDCAVTFPSIVEGERWSTFLSFFILLIFMGLLMPHKVKSDVFSPFKLPRQILRL